LARGSAERHFDADHGGAGPEGLEDQAEGTVSGADVEDGAGTRREEAADVSGQLQAVERIERAVAEEAAESIVAGQPGGRIL